MLMNSCWKRRKGYALGGLVAVLLGMGRAEAAISGGGELFLEETVERVAQNSGSPGAVQLMEEGLQLYNEGTTESLRQAIEKFEAARQRYHEIELQKGEATALWHLGVAYEDLGDKQEALNRYNQALSLFKVVGDLSGEAATLARLGGVYDDLGDKQKALTFYEQALELLQELGNSAWEAATLIKIGTIYLVSGENQKALYYLTRAIPLLETVEDRFEVAQTLNLIARAYNDLSEKQKALDSLNQSLSLFQEIENLSGAALALNNIGTVYFEWGQYQQALNYFNQALSLSESIEDFDVKALALNHIGAIYFALGENQRALDHYKQAVPLFQSIGFLSGEASTRNNMGNIYQRLGKTEDALAEYTQALLLNREVGNRAQEATTLTNMGSLYATLGEPQKALDYYKQALPLSREVGDRSGEAHTLNNLSSIYFELGQSEKAIDYLNQALPLTQAVGDQSGEAVILLNLAADQYRKGQLTEALTSVNTAIEIIEQLRSKIASDDLRMSYFATVQRYYQLQLDLLMFLHQQYPERGYDTQAFNTSERSRARVLLELLYESNLDIRQGVSPQLLEDEDTLLRTLKDIETRRIVTLNRDHTEAEITALDKETDDTLAQLDLLKVQLKADNPAYAALQYPEPLTLPQIQQQVLDKDSLLLQYAIGKDRSYLWAVTPTEMTVHTLPGAAELAEAIEPFRSVMETSGNSPADIADAAKALGDLILAPVADQLPGKRLLIVADGDLHAIPFAALSEPGNPDYTPLIAQHEIVNLPSASSIAISRQQVAGRTPAPKTLAVLADPVYTSDDPRIGGSRTPTEVPIEVERNLREFDLRSVARLPYTRQEADTLLALVPPNQRTAVFDFDADYDWATQTQLNQYRYIHFATHGFANPSQPELSGILLSLVNPQGSQQDKGILRLHDIFNLDLPAELVVLSACQTGLGTDTNGEGLIGLTRGLMYAGTPRTLVSLWNVNDEKTSILMSKFYRGILEGGLTPAAALRQAQIQMWQEYRDPNLWAAFVLQGEWK